jgi:hypothetical protein
VVVSRNEKERVLIEPSINSVSREKQKNFQQSFLTGSFFFIVIEDDESGKAV